MTQPERFIAEGKLNREALAAELQPLLDQMIRLGCFELSYDIRLEEPGTEAEVETPEVVVVFRGRDQDLLLERNAELLQAFEYIVLRGLRLDPRYYDRVRFDSGDYRALRIEELKLSARVAAERVRETRQPFRFNPMPARERRIVHLVLKDEPGVRTSSDGAGEQRFVVVYPADAR